MGLTDAIYVPAPVDKMFGMTGTGYVVQFNGATGAKEAVARVAGPIVGGGRITWHAPTSKLYCAVYADAAWANGGVNDNSPLMDIFPVDPLTLAVGPGLSINTVFNFPGYDGQNHLGLNGPWQVMSDGAAYLYGSWRLGGSASGAGLDFRVNPANTADHAIAVFPVPSGWSNYNRQQFDLGVVGGNAAIFAPDPQGPFYWNKADFSVKLGQIALTNPTPLAAAFDGTNCWAVCGNLTLVLFNLGGASYTCGDPTDPNYDARLNLENGAVITGAVTGVAPCRLRYCGVVGNPWQGKLLIPVPNQDGVIVYDPVAMNGVFKGGFDGPLDVVLTPGAAWAVQLGAVGLRQIT